MFGKGLRAYQLSTEFLNEVMKQIFSDSPDLPNDMPHSNDFKAFCSGCGTCHYRNKCDMQAEREKSDGKRTKAQSL